ncbi:MAG: FHA domain-containing protein [Pseudomonadota bacterium]
MSLLAAHINDAGIAVYGDQGILYREPGFALLEDRELVIGETAYRNARLKPRRIHSRFWSELRTDPLSDARFRHLSAADLVSRQLEKLWQTVGDKGDRLIVAVPPYMSGDQLGLFLGIAADLRVPIVALVDAAVAATRREYTAAAPVHVDFSLHSASTTRLSQNGQAQVERSALIEDAGTVALTDAWIKSIAEAFVQQSRFDPLHTAETEQYMQDRLPEWLQRATADGRAELEIDYRGIEHRAEVELLDLIAAVDAVYQRVVSQLRAVYRADELPAIQLSDRAARLPGLADTLAARVGGDVFVLEPGATCRGLAARCREMQRSTSNVSLLRQLPWDQAAASATTPSGTETNGRPSHVLFGSRAYAIDETPLVLGSQSSEPGRFLDLPADMPGLSRQHCMLRIQGGQCVVEDYSRYGTYLNGHRIDGSAVLQIGDLLRVGTPGHELRMIVTEGAHGS